MTNKWIATTAVLSFGLTGVHVIGGGADVHAPLLTSDLSVLLKGYASVLWHAATANLLICSIMLAVACRDVTQHKMLISFVNLQFLAFAGLFLFYGETRLGSVFVMPQWIAFLGLVALALAGLRAERRATTARVRA